MARQQFTKVEAALRQQLANVIHDMDKGKLDNNKLYNLQSAINSKIYEKKEEIRIKEKRKYLLPTVSKKLDSYVDNIDCDIEDYDLDDFFSNLREGIDGLVYAASEKSVAKQMKYIGHIFKDIENHLSSSIKTANSALKSVRTQFDKLKSDVKKDLKVKGKKNANK